MSSLHIPGAFYCKMGLDSSYGLHACFLKVCIRCAPAGTFSSLFSSERNQLVWCESALQCEMRHDMGGKAEISLWSVEKAGTGFQVESTRVTKQGMQVTITLCSPFPMLCSSLPSPFQFRNFCLGCHPSLACCYGPLAKISLGGVWRATKLL